MTAQTPNVDPDSTIRLDAQSALALAAGDRLGTQRGRELRPLLSQHDAEVRVPRCKGVAATAPRLSSASVRPLFSSDEGVPNVTGPSQRPARPLSLPV
jgi:hypothetical protein